MTTPNTPVTTSVDIGPTVKGVPTVFTLEQVLDVRVRGAQLWVDEWDAMAALGHGRGEEILTEARKRLVDAQLELRSLTDATVEPPPYDMPTNKEQGRQVQVLRADYPALSVVQAVEVVHSLESLRLNYHLDRNVPPEGEDDDEA